MFERFSSEARAVVVGAERYANELGDHHVQTHHLLLGTLDQTGTIAVRTLVERGVDIDAVRRELVVPAGPSDATSPTSLPFAPEAKKALELSLREALNLGDNRITCEHLLLALLQQPDTTAAQALTRSGSDPERMRAAVLLAVEAERGAPRSPRRWRGGSRSPELEVVTALREQLDRLEREVTRLAEIVDRLPRNPAP
ncbi:MAG: Clp protease [Actinobacteria bacterium]|jgi:ATP-dependent Clp protease ATP-binding subunit ClpC|nr:MAG: Clp protease [Actinomycetota bacterium]